jgi:acyl carrier protein
MRSELMNIEEKVKEMIGRAAGLPAEKIAADIRLADLDMESLEKLECVLSLEDALHVEIKEDDLWRLKTVQDVIDAVRRVAPASA